MCDYSQEHLQSVQAKEGERYKLDLRITHGFIAADYSAGDYARRPPVAACVLPGQRLALSNLMTGDGLLCTCRDCMRTATKAARARRAFPTNAVVTVVSKRDNPARYDHFGAYNDGVQFEDGRAIPLVAIYYADMTVVPVQPKLDLKRFFSLPQKRVPAASPEVRELVDAD